MIRVSVSSNSVLTNQATFDSQVTADAWIAACSFDASAVVVCQDVTTDMANAAAIKAAKKTLADTDWYVLRQADAGTLTPDAIKLQRANARLLISNLMGVI